MSLEVVMCFGVQARPYGAAVARAVRSLPGLAGALLQDCDVGVRLPARALLVRVRLCDAPGAGAVVDQLARWSARAHGFAVALRGDLAAASGAVADALRDSDTLALAVGRDEIKGVLERALAALWPRERCAGAAPRLDDGGACASRTAGRLASRRPRRHSPVELVPSRSPTVMS